MTWPSDNDRARSLLGMRGAFEGVARWPWMASGMGMDDADTPTTNRSHHSAQRVVEKVGRSITNSETPHPNASQQPTTFPEGPATRYALTISAADERERRTASPPLKRPRRIRWNC